VTDTPIESLRAKIKFLFGEYHKEMNTGTRMQEQAWMMMNEAESAAEGYVEMRKTFRARKGPDGYGDATNDYSYSQFSDAKKAVGDNQWYMQRAVMRAGVAQMHFAKATAWMTQIQRTEALIAQLEAKGL
jgi:hypothetical protein